MGWDGLGIFKVPVAPFETIFEVLVEYNNKQVVNSSEDRAIT